MTHFANLMTSLSNSIRNMGLCFEDTAPEKSSFKAPFDSLRIGDHGTVPDHLPALFDSRERNLGNPARLFPGRTCKQSETEDLNRVTLQWLNVLDGLKPYGLRGQISGINTYLNRSTDTPTLACLGQEFPWTKPLNIFHNAGSEHIAFAKYLSLRKIGVSAQRLRLVWIEDAVLNSNRVVLAATFDGRNYIMDSQRPEILEDHTLTHFRPYCSTNKARFSLHWDGRENKGWETSLKQLGAHALH